MPFKMCLVKCVGCYRLPFTVFGVPLSDSVAAIFSCCVCVGKRGRGGEGRESTIIYLSVPSQIFETNHV